MPGRKYAAASSYRYGFNGKENDNDVKGEGNQQDYGMRIYDPRLGRFLSVDPLTKNYPSLSPYLYALNNPTVLIDRDGEDAVVSITRNKDGGGKIKVQTIVHITGSTEGWRVNVYNSAVKKIYTDQTVNVEGKTWNIQYDIKYVYDATFDDHKLKPGENVLNIDPATPMSGPNRTHVELKNNKGYVAVEHRKNPDIIGHETGHLIGFNDQYTEINGNNLDFVKYLKNKYNSKEDLAPGGKLYQMLKIARETVTVAIPNEGFENNEMNNNKGGFTDEQNKALVNKVLNVSNAKDGTFIIQGYFDQKGAPSKGELQKAYEDTEKKILEELQKQTEKEKPHA